MSNSKEAVLNHTQNIPEKIEEYKEGNKINL